MLPFILKEKFSEDENYNKIKTINFIHSLDNNRKIQSNYYENFDIKVKYKKVWMSYLNLYAILT